MRPETPLLTVDGVIFDARGRVLLIRRRNPPFQHCYALPGGFVEIGETVEAACAREVEEETGVRPRSLSLLGVYSDPGRDPRGHTVSVVFVGEAEDGPALAGSDAEAAEWVRDWRALDLAFDHAGILNDAEALRKKRSSGE